METELSVDAKETSVHNSVMEGRIITDIREMDMDNLLALIEYMYHVKASTNDDENIIIKVDEEKGFNSLKDIF